MVFLHVGLLPHRSLVDNVAFGLELQGADKSQRRELAASTLEVVGLRGMARALATNPDILLFDEPFSALDPLIRREMQDEVIRLRSEVRKTMVFITHDLSEALRHGERIAIRATAGSCRSAPGRSGDEPRRRLRAQLRPRRPPLARGTPRRDHGPARRRPFGGDIAGDT